MGAEMTVRRLVGTLAVAVAFASASASDVWAAKAVDVSCGKVIVTDTKLANDLVDCPRHGIVIGAPNITLDLNGHTVDGNNVLFEPCPVDEPCNTGIANSGIRDGRPFNGQGFSGVTIKNGTVREFAEGGVYITNTTDNRVLRITTHTLPAPDETDGIHLRGCMHCAVKGSTASGASAGLVVERSNDVQVTNSALRDNSFAGLIVALSEDVEVTGNSVTGTTDGDGIVVFGGSDLLFAHNVAWGNGGGLGIQGSRQIRIEKNSLHDNGFVGVYVYDSDDNVIDQNYVARNGDGAEGGIHLLPGDDPDATSDRNVVSNNTLIGNIGDGLLVDARVTAALVRGNRATQNTDDGLDLDEPSTTVAKNAANDNHDLGIEGVPGVTDGGGNRAKGNGNPLQCMNIFCK
jgi:parallel beta-helix repeat protein